MSKPTRARCSSARPASAPARILPCVLFNLAIGANVTHVPYRGEGPVMQDLIGGRIDYMCATIQSGAAQAKEGTVKGIAVMAEKRVPIIPDLATTGEQGLAGVEASGLERVLLAEGHARPDRAQAQQGDERHPRRSGHPQAAGGARPRDRAARAPHARISRQVSAGRRSSAGQSRSARPASARTDQSAFCLSRQATRTGSEQAAPPRVGCRLREADGGRTIDIR